MNMSSFTAGADCRAYAPTMTGFSAGFPATLRDIVALNGTTMPEAGDEGGAIWSASNIAGTAPATAGTHYVKVRQGNAASLPGKIRPYDFYLRVLSGSPIPEREPSHEGFPPAPRSNGWGCRVIPSATAKNDSFAITVRGGATIVGIVCVDLERGAPEWNVIDALGVFTGSFIIRL